MYDPKPPVFRVDQHDDFTTIHFQQPQLTDSVMTEIVSPKLNDLIDRLQPTRVVFNLEDVEYLSSAAIISLLIVRDKLKRRECGLSLCCLQPQIESIFRVSRLDEIFQISDHFQEVT